MRIRGIFVMLLMEMAIAAPIYGQAVPAATRAVTIQIGVGVSAASPDYNPGVIKGGSIYGDMDFRTRLGIVGIEGEIHDLEWFTPRDIGENSYLMGLRYGINKRGFHPYGKVLAGLGTFQYQKGFYPKTSSSTYKMIAFGGGLDYIATKQFSVRIFDLESQDWPRFRAHGLTPFVVTAGIAYRFH